MKINEAFQQSNKNLMYSASGKNLAYSGSNKNLAYQGSTKNLVDYSRTQLGNQFGSNSKINNSNIGGAFAGVALNGKTQYGP